MRNIPLFVVILVAVAWWVPRGALAETNVPAVVDTTPTLAITGVRVLEGDHGFSHLVFALQLSGPPNQLASVRYATFDGTATVPDEDYIAASGQIVFMASDTLLTIDVAVAGDLKVEGNEWLRVKLSDPVGVAFADSEAFGIITNDERATFTAAPLADTQYLDGVPIAFADFNGDGDVDLPLFAGGPGTSFYEIPGFDDLLAHGSYHGGSWCDYDRDGDPDLFVLGYFTEGFLNNAQASEPPVPTPNIFLRNMGDGTFVNVAPALGMDVAGNGETAVWGDFDGDGWPDLFAPFYAFLFPYRGFLYHNNGDGTFTDVAAEAGVTLENMPQSLRPEGACAIDWNDDGYLDIYCASHLFQNDGTGHFTDVRDAVGLPVHFDEGAQFIDYDNDGDLDLYIRGVDSPHLYRQAFGQFFDVTEEAGIGGAHLCWGDNWADVDNDGDLDLVQNGCDVGARLMLNQGDGTFVEDPDFSRISSPRELTAMADADGDGDLEIVIGPIWKQILVNQLHLKPGFNESRLRVRVVDADGLETQHGATVRLRQLGDGPRNIQTRVVDGGSGYLTQNEYTVQFGGVGSGSYCLEVVFPSAIGTRFVVDSLASSALGTIDVQSSVNGVVTVYRDGRVDFPPPGLAAVAPAPARPGAPGVLGNPSPTPARGAVSIRFTVFAPAPVEVLIHDVRGGMVRRLELGSLAAGPHSIRWDASDAAGRPVRSGIYLCSLFVGGRQAGVRKIPVVH